MRRVNKSNSDGRERWHNLQDETHRLKLLTPREREVVELVARGFMNRDIAARLFVSPHTVKNHLTSIYRKLQLNDRTQIALLALAGGLVNLEATMREEDSGG